MTNPIKILTDLNGWVHDLAAKGYFTFFNEKNMAAAYLGGMAAGAIAETGLEYVMGNYLCMSEKATKAVNAGIGTLIILTPALMGFTDETGTVAMVSQDPHYYNGLIGVGTGIVLKATGAVDNIVKSLYEVTKK